MEEFSRELPNLSGAAVRGEAVADHKTRGLLMESLGWIESSSEPAPSLCADIRKYLGLPVSARAADAPSEPSERLNLLEEFYRASTAWEHICGHPDATAAEERKAEELFIAAGKAMRTIAGKSRAADALDSQPTARTINYVRSEWESMCRKAVAVLNKHIVPDGISDHEALNELYGIFDSDEYRATGAIEQDACEARQAVQMNIDRSFASSQPTDGGVRNG